MTMLPEIPAQHMETTNSWADRFMQQRGLHLQQRITLVQKLNHSHIINMCQKYNYLLGQKDNAHKTSALFTCRPNDAKGSNSLLIKTMVQDILRITVKLSLVAGGRKLISFIILKRNNLLNENSHWNCISM